MQERGSSEGESESGRSRTGAPVGTGVRTGPATGIQTGLWAGVGAAILLAAVALLWCLSLSHRLALEDRKLAAAEQKNVELAQKQGGLEAQLRVATETLGQSVGITQKQIALKTERIIAVQMAAAKAQMAAVQAQGAQTAKIAAEQVVEAKRIGAVASDVSLVKTDVGGAKASIAETKVDLASTKAQLQRAMGDEGVLSGLIARNHDELDQLRHRGDREYFEFTLKKGMSPLLLSTVKLQVKKVDEKRSKYTLLVSADDRRIEKKDKSLDEPVQFYSGKDSELFEIVVNVITKNEISGYLSTPKEVSAAPPSSGK